MSEDLLRINAFVSGRVQGVGFRYFVLKAAQPLAVHGWVRNLADGRVELMAEGSKADLDSLLSELEKGPSVSEVEDVEVVWGEARQEFTGFGIHRSA